MKLRKTLLLLLLLYSLILTSQTKDSIYIKIEKELDIISSNSLKFKHLIKTGDSLLEKDLYKSEKYFERAKDFTEYVDEKNKAAMLKSLGSLFYRKGDYSESLSYYLQSKIAYEKLKDTFNIGVLLLKEGMAYRYLNENERAIENYRESIKLATKINDSTLIGRCYITMGGSYRRLKKLDSSFLYYNKALTIFKKLKNDIKISNVNNDLAILYGHQKRYDKALEVHLKNLNFIKKNHSKSNLATTYFNIGFSFRVLKEYDKSLAYLDSSYQVARKEGFKYRLSKIAEAKAKIFRKKKDYKKAYYQQVLFKKYSDSIFSLKKQKQIRGLQLKHEFDGERKELELIAYQRGEKNKLYSILLLVIVFMGLIIGFLFWKNHKSRNKIITDEFEKEKLKKEILAQKVKASEFELKQLIADNSMRLEFIKQLSNQIKEDKNFNESKSVKIYANGLLLKLQNQISTESKLTLLREKISEVNQGFEEKLITLFPKLTKTEREVCSLLRLNLSIKEIASIRNATIDSVKALRYRIRKKVQISKNVELECFIQQL